MTIAEVISNILALVALALGLWNAWTIWRENGPRLNVEIPIHHTIKYQQILDGKIETCQLPGLKIRMSNPTLRPVYINGIFLCAGKNRVGELKEWQQMMSPQSAFFILESFRQREYVVDREQITTLTQDFPPSAKKFRIQVCDEIGRDYYSQTFVIQPE